MRHFKPPVQVLAWIVATLILGLASLTHAEDNAAAAEGARPEESPPPSEALLGEEEEEEPAVPPLVLAAEKLLTEADTLRERHDQLEQQLKSADESDQLVLDRQLIEVKLDFLKLTGRIVANLLAQEQAGLEVVELRELTTKQLNTLTPSIVRHIKVSEKLTQSIRRQRDEADVAEVLQIEQELEREVYWLDRLYRSYVENIQHREALGLGAKKPTNDLLERLGERTRIQAARLELVLEQLREIGVRIAEQPDETKLLTEKASLEVRRKTLTTSLSRLVKMMNTMEQDASEQQKLLITSTGEVTSDIFKPDVALGLVEEWVGEARQWVRERGPGVVFKILLFVIIITIARVLSGLTRRIMTRALVSSRMQASQLLQRMTIAAISNTVLLLGILIALSQLGFELGPLLAGLGIAGFVIGFALQDSLANFAAGMMILGYRPFDQGDVIDVAGARGTVHHMSLVSTTILTFDNRTLIIPNNKIWGDVVTNLTHQDKRRVDLMVRIGYEQDIDRCEAVLRDVLAHDDRILQDPPPVVKLHEFGEFAMEIIVRPWARTNDYWDVYWDMTGAIKRRLDREGIPIAVPLADIRIRPEREAGS
ncbi:MAG: mechanosensitive ion channel [Deltaproteobacteria bacterium]|nr:mechanosensitive ion channel [Deltaproteobacteria bacterium]MBW2383914.1 mechanosensitive ion channel [Deltaproteobacteria bacterium]MBW2695826.1 mechanosensitive ion channel [Deltaproteobacteria bacterium]